MRRKHRMCRATLLGCALGLLSSATLSARAADIFVTSYGCYFFNRCGDLPDAVFIRGDIVGGDAKKFRDVLRAKGRDGVVAINTVFLRSRGGNAREAIEIGRDVRQMLMETQGPLLNYSSDNRL